MVVRLEVNAKDTWPKRGWKRTFGGLSLKWTRQRRRERPCRVVRGRADSRVTRTYTRLVMWRRLTGRIFGKPTPGRRSCPNSAATSGCASSSATRRKRSTEPCSRATCSSTAGRRWSFTTSRAEGVSTPGGCYADLSCASTSFARAERRCSCTGTRTEIHEAATDSQLVSSRIRR